MSWITSAFIIIEGISTEELAKELGHHLFQKDSKRFSAETFYIIKNQNAYSILYSYKRNAPLPTWVITSLTKNLSELKTTLISTNMQFDCGPAGVIKLQNGEILDGYGISSEESLRKKMLLDIELNKELIYNWYRWDGSEQRFRNTQLEQVPVGACNNYIEKMIFIAEEKVASEAENIMKKALEENWILQEPFERFPDYNTYVKMLETKPLNKQSLTEENLVPYIIHSSIIKEIEEAVMAEVPDAIESKRDPYSVYSKLFSLKTMDNYFYGYQTVEDLNSKMTKYKEVVITYGIDMLEKETYKMVYPGIAIYWFGSISKKLEA